MQVIELKAPYLIFLGDEKSHAFAKTGKGLVEWRGQLCSGQYRLPGGEVDLGLADMSLSEAVAAGVKSLVIGTVAVGGHLPQNWIDTLAEAASMGLDIVSGMHTRLADMGPLVKAAELSGARLIDVRMPPKSLPVGTGKKRSGKRLLMMGTDCAVGKKYTALALEKDMVAQGMNADFRATGQTGIMIAGQGIAIDSVVSDFVTGAAELLSPDNTEDHWDVIEGQGGIIHPGFCAVTMGLLVGSQPDAFVVCHEAERKVIKGWPAIALPTIEQVIERTVTIGALTNPDIECVGISVNTSNLPQERRERYLQDMSARLGLPCVDPLKGGTKPIIDYLQTKYSH